MYTILNGEKTEREAERELGERMNECSIRIESNDKPTCVPSESTE